MVLEVHDDNVTHRGEVLIAVTDSSMETNQLSVFANWRLLKNGNVLHSTNAYFVRMKPSFIAKEK
jgi:hypothetical protein